MVQLRIPVGDIKDEGLQVEGAFSIEDVRPAGAEALPVASARIAGLLTPMGDEALFRGSVSGTFLQACDRCLEPLELPFRMEVTWFFEPDAGDRDALDDDGVCRLDGDVVDLGRYAWEEMALAMPLRFVCPDAVPCEFRDRFFAQAAEDETNGRTSPFAKLKDLFPADGGDENKE